MEICDSYKLFLCSLWKCHWNPEIFKQVIELSGSGFEIILLNWVAYIMDYHNFELALHLGYC